MAGDITEDPKYQEVAETISSLGVDDPDRLHQMTLDILGAPQDDPSRFVDMTKMKPLEPQGGQEVFRGLKGEKGRAYDATMVEQAERSDTRADELAQIRSDPAFMESYKKTMEKWKDKEDLPYFRTVEAYGDPHYNMKARAEFLRSGSEPVSGRFEGYQEERHVSAGSRKFGGRLPTSKELGYWEALEELERRKGVGSMWAPRQRGIYYSLPEKKKD